MRSGIFAIDKPDVYGSGKNYVVFGEAKQQDAGGQMASAARQFQQPAMQQQAAAALDTDDVPDLVPAPEAAAAAPVEEEAVDETGIDAKDIDLVMSQASCSRSKAVNALKENDGDLVNAIMALTT
jgi:nascent polypeptide-associated complex subunit alpha